MVSKKERNRLILNLYSYNSTMSMAEIGRQLGISRQRVSKILKVYKSKRQCSNCYYFQEFGHCSIREQSEVVTATNKCSDWLPLNGVCK
jgi:DNA-binding CsgD family transcriptional regulator